MTEKEKMLSGKMYFAFDAALVAERQTAREITFEINNLRADQSARQKELLRSLLGKTGQNFHIELPFRCDYGYNIEVGENFYSNCNCTILDCAKVIIGDNVMFAPNVSLFTAGHPIDGGKRNEGWEFALPITIGNNVWVGGNVVLNPGVTVGDNVVIGSGSVVTKDIPPNVVAVGNPCRVLRDINEQDLKNFDLLK